MQQYEDFIEAPAVHSIIPAKAPEPENLQPGALAVNLADKVLYSKDYLGNVFEIGQQSGDVVIASAATLDLTEVREEYVDISGSTAISALAMRVGQVVTLRFTDSLTLTHAASLVLVGAGNISTAAGDMATFRCYKDDIVRCSSYSFATGSKVTGPLAVTGAITSGRTGAAGEIKLARASDGALVGTDKMVGDVRTIDNSAGDIAIKSGGVERIRVTPTRTDVLGAPLRVETLEVRNSSNNNYYTLFTSNPGDAQSLAAIGPAGAVTQYVFKTQVAGTLAEVARLNHAGYFKATANAGSYAVPNFFTAGTDSSHQFVSNAALTAFVVSNLSSDPSAQCIRTTKPDITNGFHYLASRTDTSTTVYRVAANGDVSNVNNVYGAISDAKLKQDVVDAGSQWDDLKAVRIRKYRFKDNPDSPLQIGVIAQELEEVSPGLIDETTDYEMVETPSVDDDGNATLAYEQRATGATTKSVKHSILTIKAIKALQEAMTRIEELERVQKNDSRTGITGTFTADTLVGKTLTIQDGLVIGFA